MISRSTLRSRLIARRAAAIVVVAATIAVAPPSAADVHEVRGGAFAFYANVSLFGGPPSPRGPVVVVDLPSMGATPPLTASQPSAQAVYGPVRIVDAGPMAVSTEGSLGPGGTVRSSSSVVEHYDPTRGPLRYEQAESSCTASEAGVTASTKITGGFLETKVDPVTVEPIDTEPVPEFPDPNYTREGTLDNVGDHFRFVFNEQVVADDGTITVTAIHLYLLGPIAVGDLFIGQSRCGVVGDGRTSAPDSVPMADSSESTAAQAAPEGESTPSAPTPPPSPATASTATAAGAASGSTKGHPRSSAATGRDVLPWALAGVILAVGTAATLRWARRRQSSDGTV